MQGVPRRIFTGTFLEGRHLEDEDAVTLKDLYAAFGDFASEEALDVAAFTACLQRMGIGIPALAERLFHAFDHAKSGRIDFRTGAVPVMIII